MRLLFFSSEEFSHVLDSWHEIIKYICSLLNKYFFETYSLYCVFKGWASLCNAFMREVQAVSQQFRLIDCLSYCFCLTVLVMPVTNRAYFKDISNKVSINHIHQIGVILRVTYLAGFEAILVFRTASPTLIFTFWYRDEKQNCSQCLCADSSTHLVWLTPLT